MVGIKRTVNSHLYGFRRQTTFMVILCRYYGVFDHDNLCKFCVQWKKQEEMGLEQRELFFKHFQAY